MRPTTYTHYNWCDKFAFSNGDLMEEGYVEQPPGFEIPGLEDLGLLHYLLGMEVYQSHGCIFLSQHRYLQHLHETYGMTDCKTLSCPMDPQTRLSREELSRIFEDSTTYRRLIGSLIHLTNTRPSMVGLNTLKFTTILFVSLFLVR